MDPTTVILIIAVVVLSLIILFKSQTSRSASPAPDTGGEKTDSSANVSGKSVPSGSPSQRPSSNLLSQLQRINTSSYPALTRFQLPSPREGFVGRKDIFSSLTGKTWDGPGLLCLYGETGMGKTTLAVHLAHSLSAHYRDAHLFLDMRGNTPNPLNAAQAMAHVLRVFQPAERLPQSKDQLIGSYRNILRDKKVLIVIDNAPKASHVRLLVPPKNSMLLVTAANRYNLPGMVSIHVDALQPPESEALLFYICTRLKHTKNEIAQICRNHPLSLTLAASFTDASVQTPLDQFRSDLKHEIGQLTDSSKKSEEDESGEKKEGEEPAKEDSAKNDKLAYEMVLKGTVNLCMKELPENTVAAMRKISVFQAFFDEKAEEAICGDKGNEELKRLVLYNLVQYDHLNGRYKVHERIRHLLEPRLRPSERILTRRQHAVYYYGILNSANELFQQTDEEIKAALNLFDINWENIEAAQHWTAQNSAEDMDVAKLCGEFAKTGNALLTFRKLPEEYVKWQEDALTAARQLKNLAEEKNYLLNLGKECLNIGQYDKATEFLEDAQVLCFQLGHVSDEKTAQDLLGTTSLVLKSYPRAIECFDRALEISRMSGSRPQEADALSNLSQAHFKSGDFAESIKHSRQELELAQAMDDKIRLSKVLESLGQAHFTLKKYQSALPYFKQGLSLAQLSGDKKSEKNLLMWLGDTHAQIGNSSRAISFFKRGAVVCQKIHDTDGEGLLLKRLGDTSLFQKNHGLAIEYFEKALKLLINSEHQSSALLVLKRLGDAHTHQKKYQQAIICYKHAASLANNISDPVMESKSLWHLCLALDKLGDRNEALCQGEEAMRICKRSLHIEKVREILSQVDEWMRDKVQKQIKESGL